MCHWNNIYCMIFLLTAFLKITLLKCHWTWKGHVKSNTEFLENKQLKTMKALTWDITNPFKTDLNIIK